jgi:hypothetical protein
MVSHQFARCGRAVARSGRIDALAPVFHPSTTAANAIVRFSCFTGTTSSAAAGRRAASIFLTSMQQLATCRQENFICACTFRLCLQLSATLKFASWRNVEWHSHANGASYHIHQLVDVEWLRKNGKKTVPDGCGRSVTRLLLSLPIARPAQRWSVLLIPAVHSMSS